MSDSIKDKAAQMWDDAQSNVNEKKKELTHKFYEEKGRVEQRNEDEEAMSRDTSSGMSDDASSHNE